MRFRAHAQASLKTADEIEQMRLSNRFARQVLITLGQQIVPGATTGELNELARELTLAGGAKAAFYRYRVGHKVYEHHICASVNDCVVHGIPNDRPFEPGDLVSIDYGCLLNGWIGDTAYTWCVGGQPSPAAAHLMAVTKQALVIGIATAQAGRRVFDIARAVQNYCESQGCGVVRTMVGHGVGRRLHEPPQVPNYATNESRRDRLRPGMTICIEPMITSGGHETLEMPDGWQVVTSDGSLAAHYEHCIAITENGPDVLSLPDDLDALTTGIAKAAA